MLTLAAALRDRFRVTLAFEDGDGTAAVRLTAQQRGLPLHLVSELEAFASWLKEVADLLHVHAGIGWEGHALAAAGRAAGLSVVRTEHLPYLLTDAAQMADYLRGMEDLDHLIVVSSALLEGYRAQGVPASKLTVIANGVTVPVPRRARAEVRADIGIHGPLLLTVARFTEQKDHVTLLRAMTEVTRAEPTAVLLLVGEGPGREHVEAEAERLSLGGSVRFLGQRADVPDLLHAADLFVLPSRFEGLPLALLEAMAAGLPAVATKIGGTTEALGPDHAFYVPPGEPLAMAGAILAALEPTAARQAAAAARTRFEMAFSAARMARETAAVYSSVLAGGARQGQRSGRVRIGFIGVGGMAQRHLEVLAGFDDVVLVAFADPVPDHAEGPAGRFGGRAFVDHRAMLDDAELDAVYVCVPPFAHGEVERELIARGLPFFVGRHLSQEAATAIAIATEVAEAGLITAVGYHWCYLDTVEEAATLLAANPARLVTGHWLDQTPQRPWWWQKAGPGGQMVEQGTHVIDLSRHLVGEVSQVFGAACHSRRDDSPDLDVATASVGNLVFDSGAVGTVSATCLLRWGHRLGIHLFGDGLAIELSDRDIVVDVGRGRLSRQAEGDPVVREDRDFIDAVRGAENRIRCPYDDALKTHLVGLAITRSVASGLPVTP